MKHERRLTPQSNPKVQRTPSIGCVGFPSKYAVPSVHEGCLLHGQIVMGTFSSECKEGTIIVMWVAQLLELSIISVTDAAISKAVVVA
jgi:hypothetical protein